MAAAGVLGGLLLVPATVVGGTGLGFLPVAASGLGSTPLPGAGDVLRALAGRGANSGEDLGASGRLPEADTLSPDLLAALTGPTLSTGAGPLATSVPAGPGIPGVVLQAYRRAADRTAVTKPRCGVTWSVLAAIGRIESGHARGGRVDIHGTTVSPILGPQLSGGPGMAAIRDSDDGRLDGDTTWDRAVGPMQFIPTTWARYAADGNDDGIADPHNIYDATLAAAHYLCAGGEDLRDPAALARAIFRYNHSEEYVRNVLALAAAYAADVTELPTDPAPPAEPGPQPAVPPPGTTQPPTTSPTPPTTSTTSSTSTSPPTSSSTTTTTTTESPPRTTTELPTTTSPGTTSSGSGPSTTCEPTTTTTTEPTATTTPGPGCPSEQPAEEPGDQPGEQPSATTTSMRPF